MMKTFCVSFLSIYTLVVGSSFISHRPEKRAGLTTIVLDAGHGGRDPGAIGWNGHYEKTIALAITLKLGKELEKALPGVKIHYTRTGDTYPSLYERSGLANEKKGNLFISIHCNARNPIYRNEPNGTRTESYYVGKGRKKKKMTREVTVYKRVKYPNPAKGLETYVFASHKTDDKVHAIAEAENAEIYKDPEYKTKYGGGIDPKSPEFFVNAARRTKKYFQRSVKLAEYVQLQGAESGRTDGDIRQRGVGIWVLQATAMPAILVETGYVSNPAEEAWLASADGQEEMAGIISRAVEQYNKDLENQAQPPVEGGEKSPETVAVRYFFVKEEELAV